MSFVIPSTLASTSDYAAWTGASSPAGIANVLRSCSTLVLEATQNAAYETDPETGLATDTAILEALRDGTCIQAAAWVALGIEPLTGGVLVQAVKKRKKIGTAEIEYADTSAAAAARKAAYEGLVPEARKYLRTRGLITSAVGHS